jgi:hypothetical protein
VKGETEADPLDAFGMDIRLQSERYFRCSAIGAGVESVVLIVTARLALPASLVFIHN